MFVFTREDCSHPPQVFLDETLYVKTTGKIGHYSEETSLSLLIHTTKNVLALLFPISK